MEHNNERDSSMDNENREYHRIYPPIPKVRVFIKEEPEDSDDACDPPSGIQVI